MSTVELVERYSSVREDQLAWWCPTNVCSCVCVRARVCVCTSLPCTHTLGGLGAKVHDVCMCVVSNIRVSLAMLSPCFASITLQVKGSG